MSTPVHNVPSLVPIGRLTKAHGIRGELTLVLEAESPDLISGELILRPDGQGRERRLVVERTRVHHGALLVSFKGVTTRNDAELLCRHVVYVPKDRLPALDEDEVYLSDLPGLRVFVVNADAAGLPEAAETQAAEAAGEKEIGRIAFVDVPAGQELWTIVTPDGKEILFPAVDEFVISIDLEENRAVIAPPPGLLDLYLSESGS